jgi:hypothetical protein
MYGINLMKKCGHCDGLGLVQAESRELDKIDRVVADVVALSIVKKVCEAYHSEGFFNVEK